jgi:uncharacterized protein (TIGR02145 family)
VVLENDPTHPQTAGSYHVVSGAIASFTDKTGAPGIILGGPQLQGSCTYTEPAVVGTFADFHTTPAYTASTYTSLVDERDNKIYPVVKIGTRWIMARNLNYQEGLTWQANSNSPSTVSGGQNTALIGHFWCPGGSSSTVTTSTRESCDVWGALYSWETAMSFDGKGSWSENSTYNTGAANATGSKFNHGRTASGSGTGGRGICPPNWHVPTDNEWGIVLDGMESGGGTAHQNAAGAESFYGTNAGSRGKSVCTVADNGTSGDTYVNDTQANWYYNDGTQGTDVYGFRLVPSGFRYRTGSAFHNRGLEAALWSSSACTGTYAWYRYFPYSYADVARNINSRSLGFSVRCMKD